MAGVFKKAHERKKARIEAKKQKVALEADVKKTQSENEVKLAELSTQKAAVQAQADSKDAEESSKRMKTIAMYSALGVLLLAIIITVGILLYRKFKKK